MIIFSISLYVIFPFLSLSIILKLRRALSLSHPFIKVFKYLEKSSKFKTPSESSSIAEKILSLRKEAGSKPKSPKESLKFSLFRVPFLDILENLRYVYNYN